MTNPTKKVYGNARLRFILGACLATCLVGCATSTKYKLKTDRVQAIDVSLTAASQPIEGTVHTIIFYEGPGSWKEKALWDEYLVSVTNTGPSPVVLEAAQLNHLGEYIQEPGNDPWELERTSEKYWDHYRETGVNLAKGSIGVAALGVVYSASYVVYGVVDPVFVVVAPVAIVANAYNVKAADDINKQVIEDEFERRTLSFPVTIGPGEKIAGCLFFPQSPKPETLALTFGFGESEKRLEFNLADTPLAGLHIDDESK